jgi:hypothetical protein
MTVDGANRIINEYMEYKESTFRLGNKDGVETFEMVPVVYYESLDSLIRVWDKLGTAAWNGGFSRYKSGYQFCIGSILGDWSTANTIQEAATIATAKTIRELYEIK